jgi:hypothetical protein
MPSPVANSERATSRPFRAGFFSFSVACRRSRCLRLRRGCRFFSLSFCPRLSPGRFRACTRRLARRSSPLGRPRRVLKIRVTNRSHARRLQDSGQYQPDEPQPSENSSPPLILSGAVVARKPCAKWRTASRLRGLTPAATPVVSAAMSSTPQCAAGPQVRDRRLVLPRQRCAARSQSGPDSDMSLFFLLGKHLRDKSSHM